MKIRISLMALLCVIIMPFAVAQVNQHAFDSVLSNRFPVDGPPTVVLVAKDNKVLWEKAFGLANLELNLPMKVTNVFRIGSITKQFTAVAILQLSEAGKLSLQDEITKYIPDYPAYGKKITIENVLTHTSGIKNYTGMQGFDDMKRRDITPKMLVDFFKQQPLDFEPGTEFLYDNSGYILLGYIIEKITGEPFAQYIRENIFQPAAMSHSFYDHPQTIIPGRISGYRKSGTNYTNSEFLSMTLPYAAGSLLSTAGDLILWYQALAGGKLISKSSLQKAWSSYILPDGRPTGYGYGWFIGNVRSRKTIKHVGVVNGFVTYVAYLPDEKLTVIIFTNSESTGNLDIPASELIAFVLGDPYYFKAIPMGNKEMASYQGVYHSPSEGDKVIQLQNGHLEYFSKGRTKQELLPCGNGHFYIAHTLTDFRFNQSGFIMNGTDLPIAATKIMGNIKSLNAFLSNSELLKQLTGKYQFSGFVLEIETEGSSLYGKVGEDRKALIPLSADSVFARDTDITLIFGRDAAGKVMTVTKIQNGEMIGKRLD